MVMLTLPYFFVKLTKLFIKNICLYVKFALHLQCKF